ncbi:Hypothetical protein CpCap5W_1116 [Corynebacterium pseudotuberculosis]|nr:Hypothetical protein Cp3995_1597 [Corynebacterium pseudotuberculosis 3/99-5]AIG07979.1 hypothetical protein CPTA_02150 [Corynebacterium pseudotuberculosis]AIG09664.1 hypothetical protein CPTB_01608 [Corynebacterium pseudotuberculosis]AIG12437.1 hypothetical protein CPTC_02149 [Corynebacterium pseudotuberculosis]AJC14286.1 Hypothetical protein CpVD57_1584 [Corynebacterium pseudotuberculosis]
MWPAWFKLIPMNNPVVLSAHEVEAFDQLAHVVEGLDYSEEHILDPSVLLYITSS